MMGQEHLSHLALLSIERGYANRIDMNKAIDVFASLKNREELFFLTCFADICHF